MSNAIRTPKLILTMGALLLPLLASAAAPVSCWLKDAAAPAPGTVYAMCEQGAVYATHDNAATWKTLETNAKNTLRAIVFVDAQHGLVAGDRGLALTTDDAGKTWTPRDTGTTEHLLALASAGNHIWAAGYDGALLHSDDAGRTWSKQKSGTTQAIESLYFADESHGWAAGWSGTILRTVDGGNNWETVNASAASWSLTSIYFKDLKDGWVVGFAGQLLHSRDGGATWEPQKGPSKDWLKSVAADSLGRVWAVTDEELLVSGDDGANWKAVPAEDDLFLNKVLRAGDSMWAMGQLGALRQAGTGPEWKRISSLVPAGADIPDDLESSTSAVSHSTN
jgi:photosystem II stability/assembly factor-like uncharacterized protein